MIVSDVMTREVEVIHADAPVREAAGKMKGLDVGPLPVTDGRRLVGMVTDRDITIRAIAEGRDPDTTPVRDVMSEGVVTCFADQDVRDAAQVMEKEQIRRLVVQDRAQNIVGVVSLGDLAVGGASKKVTGEALKEISEPGHGGGGGVGRSLGGLVALLLVAGLALALRGGPDDGATP
jgi:CBS domain-containing protein